MRNTTILTASVIAALFSTTAIAETIVSTAKKMSDDQYVTIHGVVDSIDNEREFTVRDETGKINVDLVSNQSVVLQKGQAVTVSGRIDNDMGFVDVDAKNVYVHKGTLKNINDAISATPGMSISGARAFNIKDLPREGMVKVTGTVTDVDNEKEFTLQDSTGSINIDLVSSQNAALTKGAKVTVFGKVDSGLMGKDINASKVMVIAHSR